MSSPPSSTRYETQALVMRFGAHVLQITACPAGHIGAVSVALSNAGYEWSPAALDELQDGGVRSAERATVRAFGSHPDVGSVGAIIERTGALVERVVEPAVVSAVWAELAAQVADRLGAIIEAVQQVGVVVAWTA